MTRPSVSLVSSLLLALAGVACGADSSTLGESSDAVTVSTAAAPTVGLTPAPVFTGTVVVPSATTGSSSPAAPSWAIGTCGPTERLVVATQRCETISGVGGRWLAQPVVSGAKGTSICAMSWSPFDFNFPGATRPLIPLAAPDYASIATITESSTPPRALVTPVVRPVCPTTRICTPGVVCDSYGQLDEAPAPKGPVPIKGMGGCSSCAIVHDQRAYVVLPESWPIRYRPIFKLAVTSVLSLEYNGPADAPVIAVDLTRYRNARGGWTTLPRIPDGTALEILEPTP